MTRVLVKSPYLTSDTKGRSVSRARNLRSRGRKSPLEHACCPFFDISIRIESENSKLCWRLSGREGIKPFIRAEFGARFGRSLK
jgi:hypothetical protein